IIQRQVETGALVAAGAPAFVVADLSSVKAGFGLPDRELVKLKLGASLSLTSEAVPGREFHGIVTSISPVADPNTRLFPVEVSLPNSQRLLLAGMIVSLSLGEIPREPVLAVPLTAVVRSKAAGFAIVVVEKNGDHTAAKIRPVTLGQTYGNRIEITSGGAKG